jgi:hypothetical protein
MRTFEKYSSLRILSLDDDFEEYCSLFSDMEQKNVYSLPSYLKSVQFAEKYPVQIMVLAKGDRIVMTPYIKRRINDLPLYRELKQELWDIITPHEYCCAASNVEDPTERIDLIQDLFDHVADYCGRQNIVSEFFRFDPFLMDIKYVETSFICRKSCDNIYIDLRKDSAEIYRDLAHSVRKNVKRAVASELIFCEAERTNENVDSFIHLYWASMRRLRADNYFYFSENYFRALIKKCQSARLFIILDNASQPVAASILLFYGDIGHHHLTGYSSEAAHLRPNDFMIYSLIEWGKANNMKYLHLGGGSEAIRNFKGKFSKERIPYYVGYRVHDEVTYGCLCDIWQKENCCSAYPDYFPLYRAGQ